MCLPRSAASASSAAAVAARSDCYVQAGCSSRSMRPPPFVHARRCLQPPRGRLGQSGAVDRPARRYHAGTGAATIEMCLGALDPRVLSRQSRSKRVSWTACIPPEHRLARGREREREATCFCFNVCRCWSRVNPAELQAIGTGQLKAVSGLESFCRTRSSCTEFATSVLLPAAQRTSVHSASHLYSHMRALS